jgi:uncharacterized protein YaeQ
MLTIHLDEEQSGKVRFNLDKKRSLTLFKHKGEPMEHVLLKALGYALFASLYENLEVDAHLNFKYQPDIVALDATGEPELWIQCGAPDADRLEYALKHTRASRVILITQAPALEPIVQDLKKKIHYRYTNHRLEVICFITPPEDWLSEDYLEAPYERYETHEF